jgi:hypothetical protein
MEPEVKKSKLFENVLFAFLGALSATMLSLGTFGAVDNRSPASIEQPPTAQNDFDPRVYLAD